MSFMKASQDELLDGFCRGCLKKYYDPAELLHYTEKNRRLFVYSTGIQVKRNDTLTFQLCKDCSTNMKISCKFKKQCRSSERRFKSYLRLKELGDNIDLLTFLRNSDDNFKFPLLSGNSTPATQKNRDDDNESTCASMRNFISDILQGEEMPDTEARIIKEVIEEQADLLEDSLDSHWLQDDASMDNDYRLDFSFSPFTTPRSVNNNLFNTPIKQFEPNLNYKNNHAKKVFQQLPTSQCSVDDNVAKIIQSKKSEQNCDTKQKARIDPNILIKEVKNDDLAIFSMDDSITELLNKNEDLFPLPDQNEIEVRSIHSNTFDMDIKSKTDGNNKCTPIDSNTYESDKGVKNVETESLISNKPYLQTDKHLGIKCVDAFEKDTHNKENKLPLTEIDLAVKSITLNSDQADSGPNRMNVGLMEKNSAVKTIIPNDYESYSNKNQLSKTENDLAVKSLQFEEFDTESKIKSINVTIDIVEETEFATNSTNKISTVKTQNHSGNKNITIEPKFVDNITEIPLNENNIEMKSSQFEEVKTKSLFTSNFVNEEVVKQIIKDQDLGKSHGLAMKPLHIEELESESIVNNNHVNIENRTLIEDKDLGENHEQAIESLQYMKLITKPSVPSDYVNSDGLKGIVEEKIDQNYVHDLLLDNLKFTTQDVIKQSPGDVIDKNLEVALKDEANKDFSLDELLVSPVADFAPANGIATVSTPTINNILFGEKLDEDSIPEAEHYIRKCDEEKDIDALEEFFKEGVKDFETLAPVETNVTSDWRYDLQNSHCNICDQKYSSVRSLKIHLSRIHFITSHLKRKSHEKTVCIQCGLTLHKSNLSKHMRTHIKVASEYKCEICALTYATMGRYNAHMKMHNSMNLDRPTESEIKEETKGLQCEICKRTVTTVSKLKQHMKSHDKETKTDKQSKQFICSICGASFSARITFIIHEKQHREDYLFKCDICGKGFYRKCNLNNHMKHHIGEKSYKCTQCDAAYILKHSLVVHMRKHIGEYFECDHCSRRYLAKNQLKQHLRDCRECFRKRNNIEKKPMKKVTKPRLECKYCSLTFYSKMNLVYHQNTTDCGKKLYEELGTNMVVD